MSKLYNQSIETQLRTDGQPVAFRWRERWYFITSRSVTRVKRPKDYFIPDIHLPRLRCETDKGMICDLVRKQGGWMLERVWD